MTYIYEIVKSTNCTNDGCVQKKIAIGGRLDHWNAQQSTANGAFLLAQALNDNKGCGCQWEVKELQ